jgi:hypothetical protein
MDRLHPCLEDRDYWDLRFKLLSLQEESVADQEQFAVLHSNLIEDLNNYLTRIIDPWKDNSTGDPVE